MPSNYQLQSQWFQPNEWRSLLKWAEPGDLLEFERGVYKHWAVFVGEVECNGFVQPCVVHAAYPAGANHFGVVVGSQSLRKAHNGLGMIALEPLEDVVMESRVRINNSQDKNRCSLDGKEVVRRAMSRIGQGLEKEEEYSVLTNNCEHFATHCRYGEKTSCQVETAQKAGIGVFLGTAAVLGVAYAVGNSLVTRKTERQKNSS